MRKADIYGMPDEDARALLAAAPFVHLATTDAEGRPVLRALHGVAHDGWLAFHGSPVGEKTEGLGRPCVVSWERVIAEIPSWFLDPERACPATTYYLSAMAHGTLEAIEDPDRKARVLQALMEKYQPEGRHAPLDASSPLYAKAIRGLLVFGLRLDRVDGKAKVGQNRSPEDRARICEALWRRGAPGDAAAIEAILRHNEATPLPAFLRPPEGARGVARMAVALDDARIDEAVRLVRGAYWLDKTPEAAVARSFRGASAVVAALAPSGGVVAVARALCDGKTAWIYDVFVDREMRGRGLGRAVTELLLDHPVVRPAREIRLSTRDAESLYAKLGFRSLAEAPRYTWRSIEMILKRSEPTAITASSR
jgi:nitroimidazol reductase NimA-like FMN-containing flavoprotein (pyridoxamine 5'-phosphate oxidase superfamily)/ribosomal protein S18 acetylase RimI-like enzyme